VTVRLRPALDAVAEYVPGRTVPGAIKLASNEMPYPPLPSVLASIADAARSISRYPDSTSSTLGCAVASRYGVDPTHVVIGCGSVSLCAQLIQAVVDTGDEVLYAWRSFEAYPIFAALNGALSVRVPLLGYTHDLDEMASRVTAKTRLIFICNPNNPTGTAVRSQALQTFLQAVPDHVVVVLDEAYREFVCDETVPDGLTFLDTIPNLVVLRTFSKAYGLAGLRVGYAITSDPTVAAAIRKTQIPFSVATVAQAAALASLEPVAQEELAIRVTLAVDERTRVRNALRSIGYEVPESHANFVWLPLGDTAVSWTDTCEAQGVIVRAFAGEGVRITIGTQAENDRLLDAAGRAIYLLR